MQPSFLENISKLLAKKTIAAIVTCNHIYYVNFIAI